MANHYLVIEEDGVYQVSLNGQSVGTATSESDIYQQILANECIEITFDCSVEEE